MVNSRFVMNDDIKFTLKLRTQANTRKRAVKNVTWLVNSKIQNKIKHYASWEKNDVWWNLSHGLAFIRLSVCLLKKKDADDLQTRVDLIAPRNNSPIYVNAWLTKCTSSATSHQTKTQTKNIHCVAGMSEIVLEDRNGLHWMKWVAISL